MNNKLLKLFKEHIDFPDDHTKICWCVSYDSVMYNTDNNVEDLRERGGETYSGIIKGEPIELDGYVMYNLDSENGFDYQAIFSTALKVDEDE